MALPALARRLLPQGPAHRHELDYAAERMTSIEINGSFYSLQRPRRTRAGATQTPDDFVFAVKGGRFITHMKQLRDVETPLANFFASGVLALGDKLGPILWQLPENLAVRRGRLTGLPRPAPPDTTTAAADWRSATTTRSPEDRAATTADADRPIRHALESRHESFDTDEAFDLLRRHDIGCVVADTAGRWPQMARRHERLPLRPAAWGHRALRQRLHRRVPRPVGRPGAGWLGRRTRRLRVLRQRCQGHAPHDAVALLARLPHD